jgi:F0F1-type ATP synthase assembly protein I
MKPSPKPNPNRLNSALKYSGMAFQMAAIIFAGVFFGWYLDKKFEIGIPVFTLVFSLLSVGIAIYLSIKDFLKPRK